MCPKLTWITLVICVTYHPVYSFYSMLAAEGLMSHRIYIERYNIEDMISGLN